MASETPPAMVTHTAIPTLMPVRGDRGAPNFDPKQPMEIKRFFKQLNSLFQRSAVMDDKEKKAYATQYVDYATAELWEAVPEYTDATKTFKDFKKALVKSYTDEACKYSVADLDQLISECQQLGIHSLADLTNYHMKFQAIATYLVNKQRISDIDKCNAYIWGFPPMLWNKILTRLHIKYPDHYLDDTYTVAEVYEAA